MIASVGGSVTARSGEIVLTVFFVCRAKMAVPPEIAKIDRSMPIVAEIEQIVDRRSSCLESRARIYDGLGGTVLRCVLKEFVLLNQIVMIAQNHRVGVAP